MSIGTNVAKQVARILSSDRYYVSHLDLRTNSLGDAGVKIIAPSIGGSKSLVHVDLSSNELYILGAQTLFRELRGNESITCLHVGNAKGLHRNFFGGESIAGLSEFLQQSQQLIFLDVRGAGLGNQGLECLLQGVKKARFLRVLNVAFNGITGEASKQVAELMGRTAVKRLDLSQNPLGEQFKHELNASTRTVIFLQSHLDLSSCGFTRLGTSELFDALRKDTCLLNLTLDGIHVEDEELDTISAFLSNNGGLRSFSLQSSQLGDKGARAVAEGLVDNGFLLELYLSRNKISVRSHEYSYPPIE